MKRKSRKGVWALGVAFVVLGSLTYYYFPALVGELQARADIRDGNPRYLVYGELLEHDEYQKVILEEKFGIEFERVAGCVVSEREIRRWDTYNEAVKEHFRKTAGIRDVFEVARQEAIDEVSKGGEKTWWDYSSVEPRVGDKVPLGLVTASNPKKIMTASAQLLPSINVNTEGVEYEVAYDGNYVIQYISTSDPAFVTPEGVSVSATTAEIKKMTEEEITKEPGFAFHVGLKSGWRVAFCQGESMTEGELKDETKVSWIFMRK